jgi:hypothetical protein
VLDRQSEEPLPLVLVPRAEEPTLLIGLEPCEVQVLLEMLRREIAPL